MNAPQAPLVVIAASQPGNSDRIRDQFHELAKKWRWRTEGSGMANGREVVFTWMDMNDWGKWMKAMYGILPNNDDHNHDHENLENVKVIIADHSVCHCYYFFLFRGLLNFSLFF
jgi:thioredoxin domain-containing protein 5